MKSLLDNDLYKFTMQQAVCKLYPRSHATYEFINRGGHTFPEGFAYELKQAVNEMANLSLSHDEEMFLKHGCYYFTPPYVDFLKGYRYDPCNIVMSQTDGELRINIRGPWYQNILWEVPLMALISELYFKMLTDVPDIEPEKRLRDNNIDKAQRLSSMGVNFADFGTRRRYSYQNHKDVVRDLMAAGDNFVGTSNLHFALMYEKSPIGTQAHEWIMFHAAKYGYKLANAMAMDRWIDVYRGDLGISLTDTFTTDNFFKAFDIKFAKLFDGVRHDSGDPLAFAEKTIKHYESLRIDPTTKTIVFSDGLNVDKVAEIHKFCEGRIRESYGIGTHFTNDVGRRPLNMVIKMIACDPVGSGRDYAPTVKLSDVPGKHTGDPQEIELCKKVLKI